MKIDRRRRRTAGATVSVMNAGCGKAIAILAVDH
jgi:hypothetical protein